MYKEAAKMMSLRMVLFASSMCFARLSSPTTRAARASCCSSSSKRRVARMMLPSYISVHNNADNVRACVSCVCVCVCIQDKRADYTAGALMQEGSAWVLDGVLWCAHKNKRKPEKQHPKQGLRKQWHC